MNLREWALPVYTILVQLAAGCLVALWLLRRRFMKLGSNNVDELSRVPILIIFSTIVVAIIGAHLHLSKPFFSFMAMANVAHSWLSREVIATVLFSVATGVLALSVWFLPGRYHLKTILGWIAALLGLATVYSMARVYLLPTQVAWNSTLTVLTYYVEAALLGATALGAILLMDLNFNFERRTHDVEIHSRVVASAVKVLAIVSVFALMANLVLNSEQIIYLSSLQNTSAQTSLKLLSDVYQPLFLIRLALGVAGVSWLVINYLRISKAKGEIRRLIGTAYVASTMVLVGEIIGRFLFYAIHVRSGI